MLSPALDRALDDHLLDAGLAIARRGTGLTCIALPVPVVAASPIVAAWRSAPVVAWTSGVTTLVGVGVAREVRGGGEARCAEVVAGAREIEIATVVGHRGWRPKLFGGLAFAPGAAAEAPWTGFGDAWFALPRWTYSSDGWLVLAVDARDARNDARWHDELAAFRVALATPFAQRPQPALVRIDAGDADAWRANVRAITAAIARGECAKIVAARRALVTLASEARPADLLAEIDTRHGECARLLVRPPNAATLLAATPERLVRVEGTHVACDALAGSQPRGADDVATLLASAKDRREHGLVVDAIASVLRELGAAVGTIGEPGIRTLRHVLHLHTPIAATLATRRHVLELVAALHPTPAMGGTPTDVATAWIASREPARGWYASPVGWFDLDGNGEFAVAIRCGLLTGDRVNVWAGAGIVAGSDPDRELAETDVKLRAMLGALGVAA
jgi:menaquinone-specific isochorismate synthase